MELRDLEAFMAVAEASGFRRASRNTGVKQSVLSARVACCKSNPERDKHAACDPIEPSHNGAVP